MTKDKLAERIADGRTDLVWDHLAHGHPATARTEDGTSLLQWCAYYGDVSAMRYLLSHGESLESLGENLGLHGASFHGHWRLCEFLAEQGADVNARADDTEETPLADAYNSRYPWTHVNLAALSRSRGDGQGVRKECGLAESLLSASDGDYILVKSLRHLGERTGQ